MTPEEKVTTETREARIFLQPIAAPSILGLFAFAAATFMVSAWMVGWYGDPRSPVYLVPFVATFGGLAQLLAGMWSYKARDGLATAMHGMWGAFWIAYGLLQVLFIIQPAARPTEVYFPELGYWFITLAAITWVGAIAASIESMALTSVLGLLAAGSTTAAIAFLSGFGWVETLAGYLLMLSSWAAFYTAGALMLNVNFGRDVLYVGMSRKMREVPPIMAGQWEPGVIHGQK